MAIIIVTKEVYGLRLIQNRVPRVASRGVCLAVIVYDSEERSLGTRENVRKTV